MPTYPEKDLFPPDRPKKRDTSKDPLPKYQLDGRVFDHITAYFESRFKERYSFRPHKIKNPVAFHKLVQSRLNEVAKNFFKDHFVTWATLPPDVDPKVAESLVNYRSRLVTTFIDFVFKERKNFGDVSWGDLASPHWWTAFQQELTKERKREQATGWNETKTTEKSERQKLFDSWNE